jgi:hypothetical protein
MMPTNQELFMPIAQLTTIQSDQSGRMVRVWAPIILTHRGGRWTATNPNTNNVVFDGVTTAFVRREVEHGWLNMENGWDIGVNEKAGEHQILSAKS